MARRIITGRKRLGQFFTPAFEAQILASWVVRCSTDRILEPSVGDGALLFAALRHANSLPGRFGLTAVACDVDETVISALRDKVESSVQLQQTDFLELDPATVRPFDAVVANPPFTRNHQLSLTRRKGLRSRYRLKGAAGLWAYFVLHARRFLRPGGRMAFVVPGAATFTEYGADLLSQLQPDFQSISLLEFSTKPEWIGNADERGVLLLVDGYQKGPSSGRNRLLTAAHPRGVLMDVELSGEAGEHGTGLGLAQDIRAAQKAKKISEYPIIRFARAQPVQANVGGDPTSDDLFDDKIDKADVGSNLASIRTRMLGVREVYDRILAHNPKSSAMVLFRADKQQQGWLHPSFLARFDDALSQAAHVAAGVYLRTFVRPTGQLIDRKTLLMRLGLRDELSPKSWEAINEFCKPFIYKGMASSHYERWWAQGLDHAWYDIEGVNEPLATTSVADRASKLSQHLKIRLKALTMPKISLGNCPWRWCALSLESSPPEFIPVDPRHAVRLTSRTELAPWVDPMMVSIGAAVRAKDP